MNGKLSLKAAIALGDGEAAYRPLQGSWSSFGGGQRTAPNYAFRCVSIQPGLSLISGETVLRGAAQTEFVGDQRIALATHVLVVGPGDDGEFPDVKSRGQSTQALT